MGCEVWSWIGTTVRGEDMEESGETLEDTYLNNQVLVEPVPGVGYTREARQTACGICLYQTTTPNSKYVTQPPRQLSTR